jgi:hypothetical protein
VARFAGIGPPDWIDMPTTGTPSYPELMRLIPRYEKELGVWMVPTLGFEITPNPPGYEFPELRRIFDARLPVMQKYADQVREFIFSPKLDAIPQDEVDGATPFWGNAYFLPGDARLLYAVIARYRPNLIIEVGCGHSTRFMRRAIEDFETGTRLVCIDPAHRSSLLPGVADEIYQKSCTAVDVSIFQRLNAGDVLFIDGRHLVMNGSDCVHLFLNVLPTLPEGVWVHVHDVFLPYDYPYELHINCRHNEQYLLAALFLYGRDWLPTLPIYYGYQMGLLPHSGGSFWMRKGDVSW